jgi:N-methylhydantoinase A/oxoprolinase/acetone carboxylase beta subunit
MEVGARATSSIVGVDVGGTFTDVFVFDPAGATRTAKALSTPDTVSGVLAALEQVVRPQEVETLSLGSTIATNALVERRLATVGLLTTAGFRDSLDIRRLWRPYLFGHSWDRPAAMVPRQLRREAAGRIDWRGVEIEPLGESDVHAAAARFAELGVEAVAVVFLFSYLNPAHESRAADILRTRLGDTPILLSSDINPERNEYERSSTTAIAAGLSPIVDRALSNVHARLADAGLVREPRVMKSNGGVMSIRAARSRPVELVKSGPAGGASAGARLSAHLGEPNLILIDIGGTTADASLIVDGRPIRALEDALEWDVPIRVPVVDIRSVGAGGGSIAVLDAGGALRVGPRSAGSAPGPVAYGRGGVEPTVTDAAVAAGLIDPDYFLGGTIALDAAGAHASLQPIADGLGYSVRQAAAAVLHMATVEMAALIRKITVDRGLDPRDFSLVAFGGAGPLFVGALLDELAMGTAIVPPGASTLSAMGGAFADLAFDYRRSVVALVEQVPDDRLHAELAELMARARADLAAEGRSDIAVTASVDLRYYGQWHEIEIELRPGEGLAEAAPRFEDAHERLWGHRRGEDSVELTGVRVRASAEVPKPPAPALAERGAIRSKGNRPAAFFGAGEVDIPIFERETLGAGFAVDGPVIVEEAQTTTIVHPGQRLHADRLANLVVTR